MTHDQPDHFAGAGNMVAPPMTPTGDLLEELQAYLDHPRCQNETLYEGHPSVLIRRAYDALSRIRVEVLEEAARVAESHPTSRLGSTIAAAIRALPRSEQE